jgi:hypothetical protein
MNKLEHLFCYLLCCDLNNLFWLNTNLQADCTIILPDFSLLLLRRNINWEDNNLILKDISLLQDILVSLNKYITLSICIWARKQT